jgi:hypothetical protein
VWSRLWKLFIGGGGFRPRLAVPSEVALRPSGDTHTRGLVHADDL